jgi:hypothetical protein
MENLIPWIQLLLDNLSHWVKLIQHPLVLAGFALMLFILLGLGQGFQESLYGNDAR